MKSNIRSISFQLAAAACMLIACIPAYAQPAGSPRILILSSYDQDAAPHFQTADIFKVELQKRFPAPIAYLEYELQQTMDRPDVDYRLLAPLLRNRFAKVPPDLVVTFGPPASRFWVEMRDSAFPDARFLAAAAESALALLPFRPNDRIVATRFSFASAIEDILQLLPETANVLMVFGPSALERAWAAESRRQLEPWSSRIRFDYSNDMSIGELQSRLTELPADSAVYFGIFNTDVNGNPFRRHSGLALVRERSNSPVFGAFDDQLGHGIIGGRLIQTREMGRELATTAEQILNGTPTSDNWKIIELSKPTYDWKELQAWGIKAVMLPPGSDVRFRPPGLWEQYSTWIILSLLFVLAQSILIFGLLYQNRRRKQAENARIDLSRKLVNANENERRLLARELHDDLSQRLARVAMDASYAITHRETDAGKETARNLYPELVNISKDVHDMSYRLHPSLVEDLGITTALRTEIERIRRQSDVEITEEIGESAVQVSPEAALCVYRIAQEALRNAIRHSVASTINFEFRIDGLEMELTVRDNGAGFDPASTRSRPSLGLLNMEERARLAGGSFRVQSRMGQGTLVTAKIPTTGASA